MRPPYHIEAADRALRRFRGGDLSESHTEDPAAFARGDDRPNSGLREGVIPHGEVNAVLRSCGMTVIFGQQTRLRRGVLLPDRRLPRFHAGHGMVRFFYGAIRQLPDYYVTALLDANVAVTMVEGPDLLVFHHPREHQSFHTGRTRRTLYVPQPVLHQAFELGYDYWALSEVLVQESCPLLDYLLLLDLVRRLQDRFKTRSTLSYQSVRGNLRELNRHRRDEDLADDEFAVFFRYYRDALFALRRDIVDRDPFDVADELYDETRERFWASLKLSDISHTYRFPTYFHIDRDIVHGAAFAIARKLAMPLEPQTPADILHDLWDEARFKLSRSLRTEALLERLVALGAEGIKAFVATVAEEQVFGYQFVTTNRYDGYNIFAGFGHLLQGYSSGVRASVPGSVGYYYAGLHQFYVHARRLELFARFKEQSKRQQEENAYLVKQMLLRVIEVRLHPDRAPDFKRRVEFADSARFLIETGEDLLAPEDPATETECLCGLLACLDRHPLYHTELLAQYRTLSGRPDVVLKDNIQPEIERLAAYLPASPYGLTSDPQGFTARLRRFVELRRHEPDAPELFGLLAALLVRLDRAGNYDHLVSLAAGAGELARAELEHIATDDEVFGDAQRALIRARARGLLAVLAAAGPATGETPSTPTGPPP
ncbi:MAG: hypothetical protein ABIL09_02765 [Gemmatimonadota bacterium]